jgi:lipopolysaccharide/colanic/teichoic acid biosynthesis glycosyltransferase
MTVWAPLVRAPSAGSHVAGGVRGAPRAWRQTVAVAALAGGDLLALVLGALAARAVTGGEPLATWSVACLAAWPLLFAAQGLDGPRRPGCWHRQAGQMRPLLRATIVACVAVSAAARFAGNAIALSPIAVFGAVVATALFLLGAAFHGVVAQVLVPERVLLVGEDRVLHRRARRLRTRPHVEAVHHVASPRDAAGLDRHSIDHVVVAGAAATPEAIAELSSLFMGRPVSISVLAPPIEGALLDVRTTAPTAACRALKRATDVLGAGVALVLLAPLMPLVALAIRLDSPGPALFAQRRVGRHGQIFVMLKFRTMVAEADELRPALLACSRDPDWLLVDDDPRVTRVGRFLRRSSLDELPQLWNVLRGEMSLVGPRPLVEVEYARVPAWAQPRSDVGPGITGLWQVSGRTTIPFEDMLRLDGMYVITWSLGRDLWILLRTVPAVLGARGAN